jgi:hypothetical protein
MPASRATAFDRLAPDQRAAVELVLRQGRSYGELSDLLGMPEETIRSRARSGLAALAPDLPAPARSGEIADWLLGQQSQAHAARTRALLLSDPAAHRWAAEIAAPLRQVEGGEAVPPLPTAPDAGKPRVNGRRRGTTARDGGGATAAGDGATATAPGGDASGVARGDDPRGAAPAGGDDWLAAVDEHDSATPGGDTAGDGATAAPRAAASAPGDAGTPPADPPARGDDDARGSSSRLGGALLIGAAVVTVAVVLAFVFTRGDDEPESAAAPAATPTATPATTAVGANQVLLRGPAGSTSVALLELFRANDDTVRFALAGQGIAPNASGQRYSIWLTRERGAPQLLGDVKDPVGEDGQLTAAGPGNEQTDEFLEWLQTYDSIAVTLDEDGAKEPGKVILSGALPKG